MSIVFQIILVCIFLCLSAMFSGSETAYFSLSPLHREKIKSFRTVSAKQVITLLNNPQSLLTGILSGNTIVNVAATVVVTSMFESFFPGKGVNYAIPFMTILLLIFGEITPKVIAARWNLDFAMALSKFLRISMKVVYPVRILLDLVSKIAKSTAVFKEELTEADIRAMIDVLRRSGNTDPDILRALAGTLELSRIPLTKFMVNRNEWNKIGIKTTVREVRKLLSKVKEGYAVVMDKEKVMGIIEAEDLLGAADEEISGNYIQFPLSVGEHTSPEALLRRFFISGVNWSMVHEDGLEIGIVSARRLLSALISEELTGELA